MTQATHANGVSASSSSVSSSTSEPLFLGLDLSTQSLKASLLTSSLHLVSELAVNFDRDLPHHGTKGGVLHGPSGSGQVYSPVWMAVEAFDVLIEKIKTDQSGKWDMSRVRCVSAAGQQHASVYWKKGATRVLKQLKGDGPLLAQLQEKKEGVFSRDVVPNWQDSSTTKQCQGFEAHIGGPDELAKVTGSRAYERFTGPQIMRWREEDPAAYEGTERISLVSSFVTTMLTAGGQEAEIQGIDESDACGMNLWDLSTPSRGWNTKLLQLIAGGPESAGKDLEAKLGKVETDPGKIVGKIGTYWQERLGFSPDCVVCPATGDNPATLMSFVLSPKEALVSLGTSDTLLIPTPFLKPDRGYHVFVHPASVNTGNTNASAAENNFFNMLVYKNGSLAREAIRDEYCGHSWDRFDEAVRAGWPSSSSEEWSPKTLGFYWKVPEIIPANAKGTHLYGLSQGAAQYERVQDFGEEESRGSSLHPATIVTSQLLSFRSRVGSILGQDGYSSASEGLARIYASGGASSNGTLLQTLSDIVGCAVCKMDEGAAASGNACSMGAAYKARWAWERATVPGNEQIGFEDFVKSLRSKERAGGDGGVKVLAEKDEKRHQAWEKVLPVWEELEQRALKGE